MQEGQNTKGHELHKRHQRQFKRPATFMESDPEYDPTPLAGERRRACSPLGG